MKKIEISNDEKIAKYEQNIDSINGILKTSGNLTERDKEDLYRAINQNKKRINQTLADKIAKR